MDMNFEPTWDENLETGNEKIDQHHQELFHLTSSLDDAVKSDSIDKIEEILLFLENYTKEHFAEEETLMKQHNYDGLAHHQKEHQIFTARVEDIRKEFDQKSPPPKLIFAIRRFIDKLVTHIVTVDIGLKSLVK